MSRVPIVEETFWAQKWFGKHKDWFQSGVKAQLWEKGAMGFETFVIPQRTFYGFGEAMVGRAEGVLARRAVGASIWCVGWASKPKFRRPKKST
jgi:hypothetical protein